MIPLSQLHKIAQNLNIEGGYPGQDLVKTSKYPNPLWVNLILVLDRPLVDGVIFSQVLQTQLTNNYSLLESVFGDINEHNMLAVYLAYMAYYSDKYPDLPITVHIHQAKHTTNLPIILDNLYQKIFGSSDKEIKYRTDIHAYTQQDYSDTGVLLSLSRCAGLDPSIAEGTLLTPLNFIPYHLLNSMVDLSRSYKYTGDCSTEDILHSTFYTKAIEGVNIHYTSESACKYHHHARPVTILQTDVLQVTELWNPTDDKEMVCIIPKDFDDNSANILRNLYLNNDKFRECIKFVYESTTHFDSSHNWEHAVKVYINSLIITEPEYNDDLLMVSSLLHDVCDHKYSQCIPETQLHSKIRTLLDDVQSKIAIDIIDNISYSKQIKGLRIRPSSPYDHYLDIISDADKLEALGNIGLERAIQYTISIGGKVPEDVIQHCKDKYIRLLPEGFIVTQRGRELAQPLHQVIADYINLNSV